MKRLPHEVANPRLSYSFSPSGGAGGGTDAITTTSTTRTVTIAPTDGTGTTPTSILQDQLHVLRLDFRRLEAKGVVGTMVLGWWLYPMKLLADPVLELAERVVPCVTAKVPFSDRIVGWGLEVTTNVAHAMYGAVEKTTGWVGSSYNVGTTATLENVRILSQLHALSNNCGNSISISSRGLDHATVSSSRRGGISQQQEHRLRCLYREDDQKKPLLAVLPQEPVDNHKHGPELLELMYQGYSYLYQYLYDDKLFEELQDMGQLRYVEYKALLGVIQQADLDARRISHRSEEMLWIGNCNQTTTATTTSNDDSAVSSFRGSGRGSGSGSSYSRNSSNRSLMMTPTHPPMTNSPTKQQEIGNCMVREKFPVSEGAYFAKFATAAYGDTAILSTTRDLDELSENQMNERLFNWRKAEMTDTKISEHTGIPVRDLLRIHCPTAVATTTATATAPTTAPTTRKVSSSSSSSPLPYFVALDHAHSKLVWSIRGPYTHREVALNSDNNYSRPFLGGEANAALSILAERLWNSVGPDILRWWWDDYPQYELIITGHGLGGGCACLLNLLLHHDPRITMKKKQREAGEAGEAGKQQHGQTNWRVFAYGSPPVYVPSFASIVSSKRDMQNCINYINDYDMVPFLSGDAIRHQIAMIQAIHKADLDLVQRGRLLLGTEPAGVILAEAEGTTTATTEKSSSSVCVGVGVGDASRSSSLIQKIHDVQRKPLPVVPGCPRHMAVPAMANVWMVQDRDKSNNNQYVVPASFHVVITDSIKMSEMGVFINKNDLMDHLPARYEYALQRIKQ